MNRIELEKNIKGHKDFQAKKLKDILPNIRGLAKLWGHNVNNHGDSMLTLVTASNFDFNDDLQAIEWYASQIVGITSKILAECAAIQEAIHELHGGNKTIERLNAEFESENE